MPQTNPQTDRQSERQQAHYLLDALPDDKISAVRGLLEVMIEPVSQSLSQSLANAPFEEDELTPETIAALDRARASLALNGGTSHEEILREFGF